MSGVGRLEAHLTDATLTGFIRYVPRGKPLAMTHLMYHFISREFAKVSTVIVQKFDFRSLFQTIVKHQITHLV